MWMYGVEHCKGPLDAVGELFHNTCSSCPILELASFFPFGISSAITLKQLPQLHNCIHVLEGHFTLVVSVSCSISLSL